MAQIQLKLEQKYNYKKDLMHHMLDILSRNGSPTGKIGLTVTIIGIFSFPNSIHRHHNPPSYNLFFCWKSVFTSWWTWYTWVMWGKNLPFDLTACGETHTLEKNNHSEVKIQELQGGRKRENRKTNVQMVRKMCKKSLGETWRNPLLTPSAFPAAA